MIKSATTSRGNVHGGGWKFDLNYKKTDFCVTPEKNLEYHTQIPIARPVDFDYISKRVLNLNLTGTAIAFRMI